MRLHHRADGVALERPVERACTAVQGGLIAPAEKNVDSV